MNLMGVSVPESVQMSFMSPSRNTMEKHLENNKACRLMSTIVAFGIDG